MSTDTPRTQIALAARIPRSGTPLVDHALTETPRPVAAGGIRVIVGFDGSPAGIGALALAARVASAMGSELLVVCVFPPESAVRIPFESRATRLGNGDHRMFVRQDAEAVLAEARAVLPPDLAVTFRAIECESAVRGLHQLAPSEGVDLLVLGATRRGPLGRLLHRSLARDLLRDPPCVVTVVSRDPRERPRSPSGELARLARGGSSSSEVFTRLIEDFRKARV